MAKKKKGGKAGKGGKAPEVQNAVIDFPPENSQMTLLYRKASFDVLPSNITQLTPTKQKVDLLKFQLDKTHRAIIPGYCNYLRDKKFWMIGDDIPDGVIPKIPAPPKPKGEKKKKK